MNKMYETYTVNQADSPSLYNDSDSILAKGTLFTTKRKGSEDLFFKIQKDKRQIRCYKNESSLKPFKKLDLKGARICNEGADSPSDIKVVFKSGNTISFSDTLTSKKTEIEQIIADTMSPQKRSKSFLKSFKSGVIGLAKAPVKISSGTIFVLEKISDGAKKAPEIVFASPKSATKKTKARKVVTGPAQGFMLGAGSAISELAGALVGLVAEPVKGAKVKGFKGATMGLGRGIAGLVFKPVAGTIDLVTHTARGVGTVPRAIYRNVFKVKKKNAQNPADSNKDTQKAGLELVYEDEKEEIYLDKNNLNEQKEQFAKRYSISKNVVVLSSGAKIAEENIENEESIAEIMVDFIHQKEGGEELPISAVEVEERDANHDEDITKVIDFYETQNALGEDDKEGFYEFFFVKNVGPEDVVENNVLNIESSFQTTSFYDKPNEIEWNDGIRRVNRHPTEPLLSNRYNSDFAVNQGIPLDDSDEIDVDELKYDETPVSDHLERHIGREGRNGPIARYEANRLSAPNPRTNIIIFQEGELNAILQSTYEDQVKKGSEENKQVDIILIKRTSTPKNNIARVRRSLFATQPLMQTPIDFTNLDSLIEDVIQPIPLKNWNYPKTNIKLPQKEIEDAPDVIRTKDYDCYQVRYCETKGKELVKFLQNWSFVEDKEDTRCSLAYKKGGRVPESEVIIKKIRNIGKEFIMKVGKTVLSGNFNLTTVPFPIKASIPKSHLENIGVKPTCFFPLYLNLAMKTTDPLQRFKFHLVGSIAYYCYVSPFTKPLNPIIGETLNGYYNDGSQSYVEQISHHPPISYLLYIGPKNAYRVYGPSSFAASAGLNSLSLATKGWRKIQFNDTKQVIHNTFPNDAYSGTLWGTCVLETLGVMEFNDVENKISCKLNFGNVKKKPSDFFEGSILVNGRAVSQVFGTYNGWIEIDGHRYFDHRYNLPFEIQYDNAPILSDYHYRSDYVTLKLGHLTEAQKAKDSLEQLQRGDAKLRKQNKKDHHGDH